MTELEPWAGMLKPPEGAKATMQQCSSLDDF
jgi:hypothetical protein